jgi:hypothetical protein
MNLYTVDPTQEIKLQGKQYFKGIAVMRSMLEMERVPPAIESNDVCGMICKDFGG